MKKWLLILLLTFALVSCKGQSGDVDKKDKEATEETNTTETKEEKPEGEADEEVKDDESKENGDTELKEASDDMVTLIGQFPPDATEADKAPDMPYGFTKDGKTLVRFGEDMYDENSDPVYVEKDGKVYALAKDDPWLVKFRSAVGFTYEDLRSGISMHVRNISAARKLPEDLNTFFADFPSEEGKDEAYERADFFYEIRDNETEEVILMYNDDLYSSTGDAKVVYNGKVYVLGADNPWRVSFQSKMKNFQPK